MHDITTFSEQINHAQHLAMQTDDSMLSFGLGIDDPKAIFGTTKGLSEAFGRQRVFDMPTSENAMTGVGIGAAIAGSRVLMTHQRLDFFLLAMDQLVNNAAKWRYMFNGQMQVPLTIRLILGRGWGQGPTHAQNLQAWFAHIPGLKVIVPSTTDAVANQLYNAIMDNDPVIFLEHRWLHQQTCEAKACIAPSKSIEKIRIHRTGSDFCLVANSYMLLEALKAADILSQNGIFCEVIETVQVNPFEWQQVTDSVEKCGHCLVIDCGHITNSFSSEVVSRVVENSFGKLKSAPTRLALGDIPEPTTYGLTKPYYNYASDIISQVCNILGVNITYNHCDDLHHDIPGSWFKGPF